MKLNKLTTTKDLKELAASIRELALMLEANKNLHCLQSATLKTKKVKSGLVMDIAIKFSLVEEGDIKEVNEVLEGIKEMNKDLPVQQLDAEEQELEESIERGEWVSVENLEEEKKIAKEAAVNYFEKLDNAKN